ncbi:MAG: ThuA domain-containing protein [Kiritimatiellae bacterium]|nr:ThuA domain-containing protein [Kiritimatiellia bacterium]
MKRALIVNGGWEIHEPKQKAEVVRGWLESEQFEVTVSGTLKAFVEEDLKRYGVIIPIWSATSNEVLTDEQIAKVNEAVVGGVGIAGFHNGMYSFASKTNWQFMTGAYWVAHPGGGKTTYEVNIKRAMEHPITAGINDFQVCSEQFYLHVDPAVATLASTRFPVSDAPHSANGIIEMPVAFVKRWGKGRVYYCSVGHIAEDVKVEPVATLIKRGMLWAAREL